MKYKMEGRNEEEERKERKERSGRHGRRESSIEVTKEGDRKIGVKL